MTDLDAVTATEGTPVATEPLRRALSTSSHLGYVTNDSAWAVELFNERLGISDFMTAVLKLRDGDREGSIKASFATIGATTFEIIEPLDDHLSVFSDLIGGDPARSIRFHHVGGHVSGPAPDPEANERLARAAIESSLRVVRMQFVEHNGSSMQGEALFIDMSDEVGHWLKSIAISRPDR